jgi:hypothetical protein
MPAKKTFSSESTSTVKTASLKLPSVGQNEKALPGFNDFSELERIGWK